MTEFTVSEESGRTFRLTGELDAATTDELLQAVEPALVEPGDLILDLSGLTFIDSTGLRAFLELSDGLGDRGRFILRSPENVVRRVLEVTGLDGILEVRHGGVAGSGDVDVPGEPDHPAADPTGSAPPGG